MIENSNFVYIHFPKSGGSSIRGILREFFDFEVDRRYTHVPAYFLQEFIAGRQVLGSVRDPFAWYESRLNFPHFRRRPLPFLGDHSLDFIDMSRFLHGMADQKFLLENEGVIWRGDEFDVKPFQIMKRKGIGFLTFEFLFTYCRDVSILNNDSAYLDIDLAKDLMPAAWILTENMTQSFAKILTLPGFEKPGQTKEQVLTEIKDFRIVNSRPSGHMKTLSAEESEIIRNLDGRVIEFHADLTRRLSQE